MLRNAIISLLLLAATPALADPLLYRVNGADSTVWLLGSVHALRAGDYPLDERIETAYRKADRVVLEVSPAELEPAHLSRVVMPLARYRNSRQLADAFNDAEYARIRRHFEASGLDLAQFRNFEPWFVALQVFALNLAESDYASAEGVDRHFAERAVADGKKTSGLETAQEQFRIFDTLPMKTQKAFLLDSIGDSDDFDEQLERVVAAWRQGDEGALTAMVEQEFEGKPELRNALLADRNRRWTSQIVAMIQSGSDSLVIVGALHLVGENGLVRLLEEKGHDVERIE